LPYTLTMLDEQPQVPETGIALCLSGGGYRAMLFHTGALIRLNEGGVLPKLSRVSSVSGGSIIAGVLALLWKQLSFHAGVATNFDIVVSKIRNTADKTIDIGAVIGGILLPGPISDRVANAYDDLLFQGATLQDLPDDSKGEGPRFVINATSVQTAALWRFSKPFMGDYRIGLVENPTIRLAVAVAASSAFPPLLSPLTLDVMQPVVPTKGADLSIYPYTSQVILSDGGVYDNLGLETAIKRYATVLASDAGQKIAPEEHPSIDWARHSIRVLDTIDNQVRSLRKRHLIESYLRGDHTGCYWGVRTHFADYHLETDPLGCAGRDPTELAEMPTRLEKVPESLQNRLMNWGYAICDATLRRHFDPQTQAQFQISIKEPSGFPFPNAY
jgi:NTE family protein